MGRGMAYTRYVRNKAIQRKKRICKKVYGWGYYDHDGQYSKGKIHCSCWMCKYSKHYNLPTVAEMRSNDRFKSQLKEVI